MDRDLNRDLNRDVGCGPGSDVDPDALRQRWRLVLGAAGRACLDGGRLAPVDAERDAALEWLYARDDAMGSRAVRPTGAGEAPGPDRPDGPATPATEPLVTAPLLSTLDWVEAISRLFPGETVRRLEREAIGEFGLDTLVTDPAVLRRVTPTPHLLTAVLRTRHLMEPEVLALARRLVETVVRQMVEQLGTQVRQSLIGRRTRRRSRFRQARNLAIHRTIRLNLANYRSEDGRLYLRTPYFVSRSQRQLPPWQVVLLVDQSASMAGSVAHAAVTAACLCGLPGVRTHLLAFDTEVVDLTEVVTDPVELLMRVQLGGGTDLVRAVRRAADLVVNPRRAIVVLITDFEAGPDASEVVREVRRLVGQGTYLFGLAALDEEAKPIYNHDLAQRLAAVGARIGILTPGQLAAFIAEQVGG